MHGIVKAVPSGDSVLIMGNTGQVRGRARGVRRVDLGVSVERRVRSDPRVRSFRARRIARAPRVPPTDPDRVPRSPRAGWPAAGEDHHARLAHGPEDGASPRRVPTAIAPLAESASRPRLPDFLFFFSVVKRRLFFCFFRSERRFASAGRFSATRRGRLTRLTPQRTRVYPRTRTHPLAHDRVAATVPRATSRSRTLRAKPCARVWLAKK